MNTMIITPENMCDYKQLITFDETFGILDDKCVCFGALSDEGEPVGIMSAQIFRDFIRLNDIFLLPEFRRKKFASGLLKIIEDRPDEGRLPIVAFFEENEETQSFFISNGFEKKDCNYSVVEGCLGNMIDLATTNNFKNEYFLSTIDRISKDRLKHFIQKAPHEELTEFGDDSFDFERFSDSSIICLKNDVIAAAVLMEDFGEYTQISWMHGNDKRAIYFSLSMVKKILRLEYGPAYRIKCLCADEKAQITYSRLFSECEVKTIQMFTFD